jgi:hypothetical protein
LNQITDENTGQGVSRPGGLLDDAFEQNICKAPQGAKMRPHHEIKQDGAVQWSVWLCKRSLQLTFAQGLALIVFTQPTAGVGRAPFAA